MKLLTPASQNPISSSVATVGTFDGVHRGHRRLLERAIELGEREGVPSVAVTFNPHPAAVVRPDLAPRLINSFEERLALLEEVGVDYCYLVEFDQARSQEAAADFVRGTLVDDLGVKAVIIGPDFRFGHQRQGDVGLLEEMGKELGFFVEADPFVVADTSLSARIRAVLAEDGEMDELVVSSTLIRRLVARGAVDLAAELLGREFFIAGLVEAGDGRGGALLGYPTANVAYSSHRLLPADGVFAGWVQHGRERTLSAISVGTRPTYYPGGGDRLIEAFLLDYKGDLYGREVTVGFSRFLRGQEAFDTSAELVSQIEKDVENVRATNRS